MRLVIESQQLKESFESLNYLFSLGWCITLSRVEFTALKRYCYCSTVFIPNQTTTALPCFQSSQLHLRGLQTLFFEKCPKTSSDTQYISPHLEAQLQRQTSCKGVRFHSTSTVLRYSKLRRFPPTTPIYDYCPQHQKMIETVSPYYKYPRMICSLNQSHSSSDFVLRIQQVDSFIVVSFVPVATERSWFGFSHRASFGIESYLPNRRPTFAFLPSGEAAQSPQSKCSPIKKIGEGTQSQKKQYSRAHLLLASLVIPCFNPTGHLEVCKKRISETICFW